MVFPFIPAMIGGGAAALGMAGQLFSNNNSHYKGDAFLNPALAGKDYSNMTPEELQKLGIDPSLAGMKDPFSYGTQGREYYQGMIDQFGNRNSELTDPALQAQLRDRQTSLFDQMQAQASGQAPSAAEMQLKQAQEQNVAAMQSAAASQRGPLAGATQRSLMYGAQQGNLQASQQMAQMRAQEQARAQGALAGALQGARQQDIEAMMQQQGLNQQMQSLGYNLGFQQDTNQLDANQNRMNMAQQQAMDAANRSSQQATAMMQVGSSALSSVGNIAASAVGGKSDVRAKQNISPAGQDIESMLDELDAYRWDYRPGEAPEGERKGRVGVMAQDLERSPLGRTMVHEGPDGMKRVDQDRLLTAAIAAAVDLHERVRKLESRKGKARG